MWGFVIRRSHERWQPGRRKAILEFVIKGCKEHFEWWDAVVLSRNMLLQATAAKVPV